MFPVVEKSLREYKHGILKEKQEGQRGLEYKARVTGKEVRSGD